MREIDPKSTTRAYAFDLWMAAPQPMVTVFYTLEVTRLHKVAKRNGYKFNMLMCYCIGRAASKVKEFYMLPVGEKLFRFDTLAVNTIVMNSQGEVSSCDILQNDDLTQFNAEYLRYTKQVSESCANRDLTDSMVIGTSALVQSNIDGVVGMYSGIYNNPFLFWGRYKSHLFGRKQLSVSFQFHHTQMDGAHAAHFLDTLQKEITNLPLRV